MAITEIDRVEWNLDLSCNANSDVQRYSPEHISWHLKSTRMFLQKSYLIRCCSIDISAPNLASTFAVLAE